MFQTFSVLMLSIFLYNYFLFYFILSCFILILALFCIKALINRYGFNNAGVGIVSSRVKKASEDENNSAVPLGVNIGKNKARCL